MRAYSVKQLADLSGVTVRTLHHYDKIGLLVPSVRTEARYRKYGEKELFRLQQILFYRELEIPLKEIGEILDDPDFDLIEALEKHKVDLGVKKKRLTVLLKTIDNTIMNLKNEKVMLDPEELYEGLPKEQAKQQRKEAIDNYGEDSVKRSENFLRGLSKDDLNKLKQQQQDNIKTLVALKHENPANSEVQKAISEHYVIIRKFWGTHDSADPQLESYKGLGELYMSDTRFSMVDGKPDPEYVNFMARAMTYFVENFKA